MPFDASYGSIKVRMFEAGHSFDEIDHMNLEDLGLVLAVWREKSRIEKKRARLKKGKRGRKSFRG